MPIARFAAGCDRFGDDLAQPHDPVSLRVGLRERSLAGRGKFGVESNLLIGHGSSEKTMSSGSFALQLRGAVRKLG